MARIGLWTEMLTAPAALVLVLAAAALRLRVLILLLPLLWLAPALARRLASGARLDEREEARALRADRLSLFALLVMVSAVAAAGPGGLLTTLGTEWADAGLLVVAVFYLRTVHLSWHTMERRAAAHLAGSTAAITLAVLVVGTLWLRPGVLPLWALATPLLAAIPHALVRSHPTLALGLWAAGAALAATVALGSGLLWIESLVALLLLAGPWLAAAAASAALVRPTQVVRTG